MAKTLWISDVQSGSFTGEIIDLKGWSRDIEVVEKLFL